MARRARRLRLGHPARAVALGPARRRRPRPAGVHERRLPHPGRPAPRAGREPDRRPPAHLRPAGLLRRRRAGPAAPGRRGVRAPGLAQRPGDRHRHGLAAGPGVRRHGRAAPGPQRAAGPGAPVVGRDVPGGPGPVVAARHLPRRHPAGPARGRARRRVGARPGTTTPPAAASLDLQVEAAGDGLAGRAPRPRAWASSDRYDGPGSLGLLDAGPVEPWSAETPRLYDVEVVSDRRDRPGADRLPHGDRRRRPAAGQRGAAGVPRRQPPRGRRRRGPRVRPRPRPGGPAAHEAAQRRRHPDQPLPAPPRRARPRRRDRAVGRRRVRPGDPRVRTARVARQPQRRPALARGVPGPRRAGPWSATRTTRASWCGAWATRPGTGAEPRRDVDVGARPRPLATGALRGRPHRRVHRPLLPDVPRAGGGRDDLRRGRRDPVDHPGTRPPGSAGSRSSCASTCTPWATVRAPIEDYTALVEASPALGRRLRVGVEGPRACAPAPRTAPSSSPTAGDFGEVVHDGNFVMDGLVLSDGTPSPGLLELAHAFAAGPGRRRGRRRARRCPRPRGPQACATAPAPPTWR